MPRLPASWSTSKYCSPTRSTSGSRTRQTKTNGQVVVEINGASAEVTTQEGSVGREDGGDVERTLAAKRERQAFTSRQLPPERDSRDAYRPATRGNER